MLNKKIQKLFISIILGVVLLASSASAVVKPSPDSDPSLLSYVFYLYYDNGLLYADRDYEIKYDIIEETFVPEIVGGTARPYSGEIINFKFETAETFSFNPQKGDPNFKSGKIQVRAPYVADGMRVNLKDDRGNQLVTIFVSTGALCDDNNLCNAAAGENEKTCPNDCKIQRTPVPVVTDIPIEDEGFFAGFDLNLILIYVVGGIGVAVVAWIFIKWRKKKKDENFPIPPPGPSINSQRLEQEQDSEASSNFPGSPPLPPLGR